MNEVTQPKLETRNTGQRICSDLGTAIVLGKFASNEQLPTEHDLCKQYNVSRTVTREALKVLAAKGLVTARTRSGTVVTDREQWNVLDPDILGWLQEADFSYSRLLEFTQMRAAIEPEACAIVAVNHQRIDMSPIEKALNRMEAAAKGMDNPLESDIDFHISILKATNNTFFQSLSPLVKTALHFSIQLTNAHKGVVIADVDAHRAVFQHLVNGEVEAARKSMRTMLEEVSDLIIKAQSQVVS